ncbi:precorrin-3B synthase [Nitrospirillum amazonense]|uniref:Precorrin-3B synthase n=1 Tax=Nitrospirillum amazonense TaxID=28077 RepID=A0A560J9S1_9PROT|nr:precorrin-3B synthase [Nitrospirillum amazonense]MDG3442647.1 precorrin-3B synthase [Nitrospirillum amazonense]TWB67796.1 precorrin-3B synthase [Nitrospirillum amazonense]
MRAPINPPRVRGACPGALVPMAVADGLLVRLRIPGGRLPGPMAAAICGLAERHGNGLVDLSQRANLQIRGVTEAALPALTDALRELGLVNGDPAAERVRNVLCSPTCGLDPACTPVRPLAQALDAALADSPDLWAALPAKFSFVLNGGGQAPLADTVADIRFDALPDTGLFRVAVGGDQTGATPLGVCTADAVVDTALTLARAYVRLSNGRYRRLAALVAAEGTAGLATLVALAPMPVSIGLPGLSLEQVLGAHTGWVGLGFAFGGMSVQWLALVAHMTPALRLTPWRAVLLEGDRIDTDAVRALGGILAPDDPRLMLSACSGRGACDSGLTHARGDALALARVAPRLLARGHIHVSACAKGCAHPAPALVTLTARGDQAYDVGLLAPAGGAAQWRGVTPARATSLVAALEAVYTHRMRTDEDPAAFITRLGGPAEVAALVEATVVA